MAWVVRPTAFGLLSFVVAAVVLYLCLPFILTPFWDAWIRWFPVLVGVGASIIGGYVTGRLSNHSRVVLGFLVGFLGVTAVSLVITAEGSILTMLLIAVAGGIFGAAGSSIALLTKSSTGDDCDDL